MIFLSAFLLVSLLVTQLSTLMPVHFLEALHVPMWMFWGGVAIALSWCMGD
jgi:hypothetical protein